MEGDDDLTNIVLKLYKSLILVDAVLPIFKLTLMSMIRGAKKEIKVNDKGEKWAEFLMWHWSFVVF